MSNTSGTVSARMQAALNEQIREELESAYLYLALSAHMDRQNLKGFAHWLRLQWEEEIVHALKLYDFLLQRDAAVELKALRKPAFAAQSALEVFAQALHHEQYITRRINELYALAVEENDYASQTLLQWFVTEQLEEEESAREIVESLRLVGDSGASLFLLDRELSQRQREEEP
ncbi:MAG: ferritin [Bacteroidota bacterium]|nr:ferritin [Bacteroidota bacterium]